MILISNIFPLIKYTYEYNSVSMFFWWISKMSVVGAHGWVDIRNEDVLVKDYIVTTYLSFTFFLLHDNSVRDYASTFYYLEK